MVNEKERGMMNNLEEIIIGLERHERLNKEDMRTVVSALRSIESISEDSSMLKYQAQVGVDRFNILSERIKELESELENYKRSHKRLEKFFEDSLQNKIVEENIRYREALEFYASGDETKNFHGDERFMSLVANDLDISRVGGIWKTGSRAREALKGE